MAAIDVTTLLEASQAHPRHEAASIVELADGRLLLAWTEYLGSDLIGHDHAPCHIAAMISSDGGNTWGDHRLLVEKNPGDINVSSSCFLRLKSGEILFCYTRYHEFEPETPLNVSAFLCRSSDEGTTFSSPAKHDVLQRNNLLGRELTQLSSGRIILPVEKVLGEWCGQTDHSLAGCSYSDDDGYSWKECASWVDLPLRGAEEPHITELNDGRHLMYVRTQLGALFQSESRDGGMTWSRPQTTSLKAPESMPCLTRVPKTGDLLLIWNNSLYDPAFDHYGKTTPLTAAISRNEGRTWENVKDIETDPEWEFTNPRCHFTSQDKVIITYVASRMDNPNPPGKLGRSRMPQKAAIADLEWFYK